jgi:aspartate kinase
MNGVPEKQAEELQGSSAGIVPAVGEGVSPSPGQEKEGAPSPLVMKFGGTSLEDGAAIRRAVRLVKQRLRCRPVIVASALADVTDQLLASGHSAARGELQGARAALRELQLRHEQVALDVAGPENYVMLQPRLEEEFQELYNLLDNIATAGELSARAQDQLLGAGECLSSRIVHAAFVHAAIDAVWLDARACIVTDAAHTQATPLWEETNKRLQSVLQLPLAESKVPVIGGFIGATRDGIPTTLGRGGSDFTASIVGAALQAVRIEIWTDVDGILTADPKLCPEARRVPKMGFEEAADLAYFGARVLHPASIAPAMRKNIPVWVLNSRNPEGKGTEIVAHPGDECVMKAITAKKGVTVVDVEAVRWLAPELAREIFDVFERHHYSLDLLSASRGSLSLLVTHTEALPAIAEELKGLANVSWESEKALVCLVGEKVRRQPEIASQVFRALSAVDMRMICQGASERNISFLVNESLAEDLVRKLHRLLFQSRFDRHSVSSGAQPLCQSAGPWQ